MSKDYKSLVERVLIPKSKSGNDIIYACPVCESLDSGHHLYVNYNKGYFHCVKCNYGSRSLSHLVKKLGIDVNFDYEYIESSYDSSLEEAISLDSINKPRIVEFSRNLKTLTEYYNLHTKPLSNEARYYLHNRGFSDFVLEIASIREGVSRYGEEFIINGKKCIGRDYDRRIMIPSKQLDGTISFYVGRDYTGNKKNRYINPPSELAYSSEDVYNLATVVSDYVIICEGTLSALAVNSALNKNVAVATYGKSIASKSNTEDKNLIVSSQGEKLLNRRFKVYYVFYDKDAIESSMQTCKYLYDRGAKVKMINITTDKYGEKADANDLSKEEILNLIINSKEYNDLLFLEDLFGLNGRF